jgi:hypothetical protein
MKRTVRDTDPITQVTTAYEGVSLNELVPDGLANYKLEVFREFWAFRDKRVLSSDDLNTASDTIVADTVNGRRMQGETPFYFVGRPKAADRQQSRGSLISKSRRLLKKQEGRCRTGLSPEPC